MCSSDLFLFEGESHVRTVLGGTGETVVVDFGKFPVKREGYHALSLMGQKRSGESFGQIEALEIEGNATEGAHFSRVERRNAASVHLHYPVPKEKEVEWFYQEVKPITDPLWSFYMACGFSRGYFGLQVNSRTERRIIFSVWDSGNEAVDRNKVKPEDRVQMLSKGKEVVAESFGNEGTGGHSHRVYLWRKDNIYRFLVHAKPDKGSTIYSAYIFTPEGEQWELITRFRAPKDGGYLKGLHSFIENFWGANGQEARLEIGRAHV